MKRLAGGLIVVALAIGGLGAGPATVSEAISTAYVPAACPAVSGYKVWDYIVRTGQKSPFGPFWTDHLTCTYRKGTAKTGFTYQVKVWDHYKVARVFKRQTINAKGTVIKTVTTKPAAAFKYSFGPYSFSKVTAKTGKTEVRLSSAGNQTTLWPFQMDMTANGVKVRP